MPITVFTCPLQWVQPKDEKYLRSQIDYNVDQVKLVLKNE